MSEWRLRKRPPRKAYYVEFWHGGSYRRYSTNTSNKPLAIKIARKRYDEIVSGAHHVTPRQRQKVEELFERYLDFCQKRIEGIKGKSLQASTFIRARNAIRNVLEGLRVTWPEQITEQKLTDYQRRRLSGELRNRQHSKPRKVSAFGFNLEMRHFRAFLNWAKREGYLRDFPPVPMARTDGKGRNVFLTEAEVGPVLSNLQGVEWWAAFLLVNTGLRLQEMRFLQWTDVDLEAGVIFIRRKPELGFSPKQGKERDVPISPDLSDELVRRRKASGWVCPGPSGRQMNPLSFRVALAEAGKRAGLAKHITAHVLRHTFGSLAVLQAMPLKVLADIMGHSTVAITEIYVHSEAEQRIAAMNRFRIPGAVPEQKVVRFGGSGASGKMARS